jgi:DASH complex subunit Dad3
MATNLSESTNVSNVPGEIVSPQGAEDVSPLEQDLLDEYERLADNMKKVSPRNP